LKRLAFAAGRSHIGGEGGGDVFLAHLCGGRSAFLAVSLSGPMDPQQKAMRTGNSRRDKCYPITGKNKVIETEDDPIDEYPLDLFKRQIKFTSDVAGPAPAFRYENLSDGWLAQIFAMGVQGSEHPDRTV